MTVEKCPNCGAPDVPLHSLVCTYACGSRGASNYGILVVPSQSRACRWFTDERKRHAAEVERLTRHANNLLAACEQALADFSNNRAKPCGHHYTYKCACAEVMLRDAVRKARGER